MKTDETPGKYDIEAEVAEARTMLGTGYDHPAIVVEAPRRVTSRRNGRMVEEEIPAWVKFSTEFKAELAELDEYSLKVFIYIGLSVNFQTGFAYPGLRKIASETGMDKDTVAKAVADLEGKGFLTIQQRAGNSNIYKPVRFISVGRGVPSEGTLDSELSDENAEVSLQNAEVSLHGRVNLHNKINKIEQDDIDSKIFQALSDLTGGGLNTETPRFVDMWKEKHTLAWILRAIGIAVEKNIRGAGVVKYVNSILIGWEANGYPKSREEQVEERRAKTSPGESWLERKERELANGNTQ